MKISAKPIKTMLIGGIIFLVPLAVILGVTGKIFLTVKKIVAPLGALAPDDSIAGKLIINLVAVAIILVLCFIAGVIAKSTIGAKISKKLESKLYMLIPRYAFVKSMTSGISGRNDLKGMKPVRVTFDDYTQMAFEVDRTIKGMATVYLPGAPDPWSGSIIHVAQDRVKYLDASFMEVVKILSKVGVGSGKMGVAT